MIPKIMNKKMKMRLWIWQNMKVTEDPEYCIKYEIELRALEHDISASHDAKIAKTERNVI